MHQSADLVSDRADDLRMGMAQCHYPDARDKVEVLAPIFAVEVDAFGAVDDKRVATVVAHYVLVVPRHDLFCVGFW